VGLLEIGKRADIAVVVGDPTRHDTAVEHMPLVFKSGIGYRADAIIESLKGQVGLY
jgi:imidazolonepropionase-like amidohydrolase